MFSVCSQGGGEGVPTPVQMRTGEGLLQGTYPLSRSGWGRGYPKVLTPRPDQDRQGATPRYLPPPRVEIRTGEGLPQGTYPPRRDQDRRGATPRYLPPVQDRMGEGVPQGTYSLSRSEQGGGIPQGTYPLVKVPTPGCRTAYVVLDTLRLVCLLGSCRRTFMLTNNYQPI